MGIDNGPGCTELAALVRRGPDGADIFKIIYKAQFLALSFKCKLEKEGIHYNKIGTTEEEVLYSIDKLNVLASDLKNLYFVNGKERRQPVIKKCCMFEKLLREQLKKVERLLSKIGIVFNEISIS